MSYCRYSDDSDVYVISSGRYIFTCFCHPTFVCKTRQEMLAHLQEHIANGDKVPQRAIDRLNKEIASVA